MTKSPIRAILENHGLVDGHTKTYSRVTVDGLRRRVKIFDCQNECVEDLQDLIADTNIIEQINTAYAGLNPAVKTHVVNYVPWKHSISFSVTFDVQ